MIAAACPEPSRTPPPHAMSLDLHPNLSPLPPWQRAVYGLLLILGITGAVLFMIFILVEVLTVPPSQRRDLWVLLPLAYSLWHIVREIPAWGPLPRARWGLFFIAAISLAAKGWTLVVDPTAKVFVALMWSLSFACIAAARLIARRAGPPINEDEAPE
jgi:hypothetical protein